MVDNDVISEAGLLEIMNAQPFAETRNDPVRVWGMFGERVHVGDAIRAILELAGFKELREYRTAAGVLAIEKAEQRRIAESLKAENESLQQQLAAAREALQAAEADARRYHWLRNTGNTSAGAAAMDERIDAAINATLQRDRQP